MFEGVKTGPVVYFCHPKLRRLESLTICSFITKATLSSQFQGLNYNGLMPSRPRLRVTTQCKLLANFDPKIKINQTVT